MITIPKYHPAKFDSPYMRRIRWIEFTFSVIGHALIAAILAYAVLGMAGAWDEAQACINCAGGVGK